MTDLLHIAWRNIWRNKRRSILSTLAVGFAVAVLCFSMALQQGSYATIIFNTVRAGTGHLQIQQQGYWPNRELARNLAAPDELLDLLRGVPHLVGAAPRITTAALVSREDRTFGSLVIGIDPVREREVSTLSNLISVGRFLEGDDLNGALVGHKLAGNLGLGLGDEIVILGQGADGSIAASRLWVRGLIKSGLNEIDRFLVAAPLRAVQEAFSLPDAVTGITILLDQDKQRSRVKAQIRDRLDGAGRARAVVMEWPTLLPGVEQSIRLDWYSGLIIYALLVVVVGFGIANTFLMAFIERIREFGVLLSLGLSRGRLFGMVYAESVFLCLLGIACGLVLGIPFVYYWQVHGIHFGQESEALFAEFGLSAILYPQLTFMVVRLAVEIVLAAALVLALYPACKAGRLEPVAAMRQR